jgi:hypothetical protein
MPAFAGMTVVFRHWPVAGARRPRTSKHRFGDAPHNQMIWITYRRRAYRGGAALPKVAL